MTPKELSAALCRPFSADEISWKPQAVKGNRALAVAYIDARLVAERLDDVFGPLGWSDSYAVTHDGSVICTIRCRADDGQWVKKSDVGAESDQPDAQDRRKSAFSDAFKRAAVKWGVGRFLYDLPKQWCDYDPTKKQFVETPQLPAEVCRRAAEPDHNEQPADDAPPAVVRDHLQRLEQAAIDADEEAARLAWDRIIKSLVLKNQTYAKLLTDKKDEVKRRIAEHKARPEVDDGDFPPALFAAKPDAAGKNIPVADLLREVLALGKELDGLHSPGAFDGLLRRSHINGQDGLRKIGPAHLERLRNTLTLEIESAKTDNLPI